MDERTVAEHQARTHILGNEDGAWYGMIGHIEPVKLLREIMCEEGTSVYDLEISTPRRLRIELGKVKHSMCRFIDREDPETWGDGERESADDGYWPYEYEEYYRVDDAGTIPITHWSP